MKTHPIIKATCEHHQISVCDLFADNRFPFLQEVRLILYKAFHIRGVSKSEIGRLMNRERSTVFSGLASADRRMKKDVDFSVAVYRAAWLDLTAQI